MTRAEALAHAAQKLAGTGLEEPAREARVLLAAALGVEAIELVCSPEKTLAKNEEDKFALWLSRRADGAPLSRLMGTREFWGLSFALNEATLDPRADSETLIEAVLAARPERAQPLRILDIGTGTGCLLLSLLHEYKEANGTGTDVSPQALEAATENAAALGLAARTNFLCTHWASGLSGSFDVVVSNPPYIRSADIAGLDKNVRAFDPHLALDGGEDGLAAYRALIPEAYALLTRGGLLALEIGMGQEKDVAQILRQHGFQNISCGRDLASITRVVMGEK